MLPDRQKLVAMVTVPTHDRYRFTASRMKRIENSPFSVVIPGSMSLLRPAPARRMSPWLLVWRPASADCPWGS
ncbi:hypothetical protein, partial [Acidiphilium sp.]|uniref:hypothetical protein n=1 Tax=Acidiphilium sp. TaxID=527 RepID=UPI002588292A